MDLKDLLEVTGNKEVSIVQLGKTTNCIFEGIANKFVCKQGQYEVLKFEKNHFDGSYSIIVVNN